MNYERMSICDLQCYLVKIERQMRDLRLSLVEFNRLMKQANEARQELTKRED